MQGPHHDNQCYQCPPELRVHFLSWKEHQDHIAKVHNGELELIEKVDPEIIGGFVLNIADKRIDASVKGQLRELRTQFEDNPYEPQI